MRVNVILFLPFTDMILSVDSTKRPFSSAESVICVTPRLFVQDLEFKVWVLTKSITRVGSSSVSFQ